MSVKVNEGNVFKYGHAHCFVVEPYNEGYDVSELKRKLEVQEITYDYPTKQEGECIAILNIEEAREDELAQIRWTVEGKEVAKYNGKNIIKHNLKDETVHEINFTSYIQTTQKQSANATLTYDSKKDIPRYPKRKQI